MSIEQLPTDLMAAYPACRLAVNHFECRMRFSPEAWEEMRRIGTTPDRAVFLLMLAITTALTSSYATLDDTPAKVVFYFDELLGQMEHPQFLDYVKGKLGAL